jgi:pyruvate dehydrogenase E2 component (dihydrolipoamide acetyltransferase)
MATPGDSFRGNDFLLPDLGEGLEEAEVIEWNVAVGDTVEEGQPIASIETGKAQTEVCAPRDGVIEALLGEPGEMMKVGGPFVRYAAGDAPAAKPAKVEEEPEVEPIEQEDESVREDEGTVVGNVAVATSTGKAKATPAVRRLARDLHVDLAEVDGTGVGGRVVAADVRAHASGGPPLVKTTPPAGGPGIPVLKEVPDAPPPPVPDLGSNGNGVTHVPFRGLRRTIAKRLRQSIDAAVHFTVMDEADVTALDAARRRLVVATGQKISLLPFVCAAVARVLTGSEGVEHARLNATVDDDKHEILRHKQVNLGLAVDTAEGLMVPVVRRANELGVVELGQQINALASACRGRSIASHDLMGSTFTISNFGSYSGRFATPILNYPEAAILAVGRAKEGVVVRGGLMGVGKLLPLSLTCDHRVIDGATAVGGLNAFIKLLQDPDGLIPTS